ncbi:hypothetical protein HanXRQr2_Chr14g0637701 [Helianthus annuus]|uniref:Uncharacterized protein n=1 Tax=Helianthus annuus TaxID=4232 RepID=A0A9K3H7Z4_HELAN|nr:hypothetical protein HanXRQr2_Chr14g0637701 [Helianthus annuus]KAJ0655827.1 hypothetical protein HanLR1_Chr14g0528751 [Helianthus annuus]KAJ0839848.1 hypothetical protein HanPSC8_Chr14g0611661 [Helianthus annuus]
MADSSRYRTIMTGLVTLISLYHSTHVYVANCISYLSLSGCVQGFTNGRKLIGGGKVYKHVAVFTQRGPITTFHQPPTAQQSDT